MRDDAEYYIEQQEAESSFRDGEEAANLDRNCKPLSCLTLAGIGQTAKSIQ